MRNTRRRTRAAVAALTLCAAIAAVDAQSGPSSPRIAPIPESARTPEQKTLAEQYASLGMPNFTATYLNYPDLAKLVPHMVYYLGDQSTLPPRHRALLALRTAWLTRSAYLWAHRVQPSRDNGLTNDEITRVARGPDAPGWDTFEAAVLRAADELHIDSIISDPTWATLSMRYTIPQLIDTIDTVGDLTMHAGIINSVGIPIEPGITDRLPSTPFAVAATRTNVRLEGRAPRIPPQPAAGGRGAGGNVFSTFNRNPPADRVRGTMNTHVNNGNALPPKYRETLLMRIGVLCRSEYEYAAHQRVGRQAGLTDADVARILAGPSSGSGTPLEIALLRAADELFEKDVVSSETWATLAKELDVKQLFDVLITVGGYRSNSMLINSGGVQLDANMADYRFPPSLR